MRHLAIAALTVVLGAAPAAAQSSTALLAGTRVRVWLPETPLQREGPWHRQVVRGTLTAATNDSLWLSVPGATGSIGVARGEVRRVDVSRGTSRAASMFERAFEVAMVSALSAAIVNRGATGDRWRDAQEGAAWGAAVGAALGLAWPTERWRPVRVR